MRKFAPALAVSTLAVAAGVLAGASAFAQPPASTSGDWKEGITFEDRQTCERVGKWGEEQKLWERYICAEGEDEGPTSSTRPSTTRPTTTTSKPTTTTTSQAPDEDEGAFELLVNTGKG